MAKRSKNDEQVTKLINVETKNNINKSTANKGANVDKLEKTDTPHSVLSELIKANQRIASVETLKKSLRMLESKGGDFAEYAQKVAEKLETDEKTHVTRWVQKEEKPQSYIKEDVESGYYLISSDFDNPTTLYNNIKSHINYKSERDKVINRKASAELKENGVSMAELLALAKANGLIK